MRKIVISSNEYKQQEETREYRIMAKPYQLDLFEEFLSLVQACGNLGCSRDLNIFIDGDGSARFKIERTDGVKLQPVSDIVNWDSEPVKTRGID